MKKQVTTLIIAAVLLVIFVLLLFTFQVRQSEVVVVSTFLKPTETITNAGFKVKWPWPVQSLTRFDQRVQVFEDKFSENYLADNNLLLSSVFVGWRISDGRQFMNVFKGGSTVSAQQHLEQILRSAKLAVIGHHSLTDFVNSDASQLKFNEIEKEIRAAVEKELAKNNYGISVEFLGINKIGLPESVTQTVFERMKAERNILISKAQFGGEGEATKIKSAAERQAADLIANAQANATRIESEGQAEAAKTLAVFQLSPDLAVFTLELEALKNSMDQKTTLFFDETKPPFDILRKVPASPETK
ncbi:MAG: protease modulator HflC [Verrucomicrobiae bacterium]|nr:protease modulator HflC [Verrucomicrobiae bacterium]